VDSSIPGLCLLPFIAGSQNLVPNDAFEVYSTCPVGLGSGGPMQCTPWTSPSGSADYFNVCADPAFCGIPVNFQGYQNAHSGSGYTGIYFWTEEVGYKEFIQAQLLEPLKADSCYLIGFWMNLANEGCGVNRACALVTATPPPFNPPPTHN
jgi:hypothetical protein